MDHRPSSPSIPGNEEAVVLEADHHGISLIVLDPHPAALLGADLTDPAFEHHFITTPRFEVGHLDRDRIDRLSIAVSVPSVLQGLMGGMAAAAARDEGDRGHHEEDAGEFETRSMHQQGSGRTGPHHIEGHEDARPAQHGTGVEFRSREASPRVISRPGR